MIIKQLNCTSIVAVVLFVVGLVNNCWCSNALAAISQPNNLRILDESSLSAPTPVPLSKGIDSSLIGQWAVDDGITDDYAKIEGDVQWVDTKKGRALNFKNGKLVGPKRIELGHGTTFTITAWFNARNNKGLFGKWGYPNKRSFILVLDDNNHIRFAVSKDGTVKEHYFVISNTPIEFNKWYFVAASFDGQKMKLYLNGKLDADPKKIDGPIYASAAPFLIGYTGWRGAFEGFIRDVRLYSKALLPNSIKLLAGDGYSASVDDTLIYPDEIPTLHIESLEGFAGKEIIIDLEKDGSKYFNQTIKGKDVKEVDIPLQLFQQPIGNRFKVNVQINDSAGKKQIWQTSKDVVIGLSKPPVDVLYFSFYTPKYSALTSKHLSALNRSSFTSMCSPVVDAYSQDTNATLKNISFRKSIHLIKQQSKSVWPLVFFNRFYGSPPDSRYTRRSSYWIDKDFAGSVFAKIKLIDLFNDAGAWNAFKSIFKTALILARETKSPGIFIDAEPYNAYDAEIVSYVADINQLTSNKVVKQLKNMGEQLADLTNKTYPKAYLYFYYMYMNKIQPQDGFRPAMTYILEGLLEKADSTQYSLKVINTNVGQYVYPTQQFLRDKSLDDVKSLITWEEKFPKHLYLAGRIAPFYDISKLPADSWILRDLNDYKGDYGIEIKTISDFSNLYAYLFKSLDYVCIYGASAAGYPIGYDIFNKNIPQGYDDILGQAMKKVGIIK